MRIVSRLFVLALLSLLPAAAQSDPALRTRMERVTNGLLPPVVIKGRLVVPMKLSHRMQHHKVPAVSLVVINHYRIEWTGNYGVLETGRPARVNEATLFQAASLSKPVAAMAALYLVEQGKLALDEDVNRRLKTWKVPENEFTGGKRVTVRGLLSHSAGLTVSGFPGYAEGAARPTLVQILNGAPPANTAPIRVDIVPGSRWRYAGGGYTVLQQLLEDVTGKPFPQLMRELVLEQIGTRNSSYIQPLPEAQRDRAAAAHNAKGDVLKGRWHTYPEMAAAGLWTTPWDLALFAIEVQKSFLGKSNRILSQQMTRAMLTRQIDNMGLGLFLEGEGDTLRFSHGGGNEGYRCFLIAYPATGKGAVVMTNSDNGGPLIRELLLGIAKEYGWADYRPEEHALAQVDPKLFAQYVGDYQFELGWRAKVTVEDGKLYLHSGDDKDELLPESETSFFSLEGVSYTFTRENGRVTGLELRLSDALLFRAKRLQ